MSKLSAPTPPHSAKPAPEGSKIGDGELGKRKGKSFGESPPKKARRAEDTHTSHRLGVPVEEYEEYEFDQEKVMLAAQRGPGFTQWEGPHPEGARFYTVVGDCALKAEREALKKMGLSLKAVGGSDGCMSYDIVPVGKDCWRYTRSTYFTVYQGDVTEDPEKVKKALREVLPKNRPFDRTFVDVKDHHSRNVWCVEACEGELLLLEAVGLGADNDLKYNGVTTYCIYPVDEDDERYARESDVTNKV